MKTLTLIKSIPAKLIRDVVIVASIIGMILLTVETLYLFHLIPAYSWQ